MPGGGAIANAEVSVGTSASLIVAGRGQRDSILIRNIHDENILYVGASGVTTSTGMKVGPGEAIEFNDYNGPVYGIASAASTTVRYVEVY